MNELQMGIAWQFFFVSAFLFLGMVVSVIAGWWFVSELWDLLKGERAAKQHALEHHDALVGALKGYFTSATVSEINEAHDKAFKVLRAAHPETFITKEQWLETL